MVPSGGKLIPARLALLRAGAEQAGQPEAAFTVAEAVLVKIQKKESSQS
jgi:hypothetical protein